VLRCSCVWFGKTECPPLPPPATAPQFDAARERLGFELPRLLRMLYLEVANGGFGPGYGLHPAPPAGTAGPWRGKDFSKSMRRDWDVLDHYWELCHSFITVKREPAWPRFLVPLCEWGCGIYSAVDCSTREGRIIAFETDQDGKGGLTEEEDLESPPVPAPAGSRAPARFDFPAHRPSLEDWFEAWVDGVDLFEELYPLLVGPPPKKRKRQKRA
jgi:hypothetical protein